MDQLQSTEKIDQRQFKVILLGDGAVGKTSIAARFAHNEFAQSYKQTIGLDFFIKHLVLPGEGIRTILGSTSFFTDINR